MTWPRCYLTKHELQYVDKYTDPRTNRQTVLRRLYKGDLTLNETNRHPMFPLRISRRSRVFGITFAGDTSAFLVKLTDSVGETFTDEPIEVGLLQPGGVDTIAMEGANPVNIDPALRSIVPFIIEPNIVLAPNQTLQVEGTEVVPFVAEGATLILQMTFHVWEYPGMMGGPGV